MLLDFPKLGRRPSADCVAGVGGVDVYQQVLDEVRVLSYLNRLLVVRLNTG